MKIIRLLSLLITFCLQSCEFKDDFYAHSYDWSIDRIPMIKPYEIKSITSGNHWFIELKKFHQISDPGFIGVKDSIFVINVASDFVPGVTKGLSEVWFVVDTRSNSEMAFGTQENYNKALDSLRVGEVKLYDIKKVFKNFAKENGHLPHEWPQHE